MSLYNDLVRVAFENPEIREDLMPVLKEHDARFEEGKPADPTENMSPEDAEKWEQMKEEHGDKFKESAHQKVARSLFKELVDYRAMMKFRAEVKKHDEQSAELFREILLRFHKEFEMDRNIETAYNRLNNMVSRGMTDPSSVRNQIAKIADLLGMKTPLLF